jgi:hypothetical protein
MPYRVFQDSRGSEWQVWDIVPRLVERRTPDADRRVDVSVIRFADRRRDERRVTNTRKATLRGTYAQGWLAFDNGLEKRRLTPVPTDWTTCSTQKLEEYSRQAYRVPVPGRGGFLHHGDEPMADAG